MNLGDDNDQALIKLLSILREMFGANSDLNEHSLKIIVEVLRDKITNHHSKEVIDLSLHILATLCLQNYAAKHLITRSIRATDLQQKIANIKNDLIAFKFCILLEDDTHSSDIRYFFAMSLSEIKKDVNSFNSENVTHSIDILKHIKDMEIKVDFKLHSEEKYIKLLTDLTESLIDKLEAEALVSKTVFYDSIFQLFTLMLEMENELIKNFEVFTEAAFLSEETSESANALKYLATYINLDGHLEPIEVVVESVIDKFASEQDHLNFKLVSGERFLIMV